MIDHILLDSVGALRQALDGALLEPLPLEERFQIDVFLGDVTFETSYGLPGEHEPTRVRADITLEWSTWSQSAYRSWSIGEPVTTPPELLVEIAFRLARLVAPPDEAHVVATVGEHPPTLSGEPLQRQPVVVERRTGGGEESSAIEVAFAGSWTLTEALLEDPSGIERELGGIARYVALALVRLTDLELPAIAGDGGGD